MSNISLVRPLCDLNRLSDKLPVPPDEDLKLYSPCCRTTWVRLTTSTSQATRCTCAFSRASTTGACAARCAPPAATTTSARSSSGRRRSCSTRRRSAPSAARLPTTVTFTCSRATGTRGRGSSSRTS